MFFGGHNNASPSAANIESDKGDMSSLEVRLNKRFDKFEQALHSIQHQFKAGGGGGGGGANGSFSFSKQDSPGLPADLQDEDEEVAATLNNPWTTVLRGDPQVRGMMKELRGLSNQKSGTLFHKERRQTVQPGKLSNKNAHDGLCPVLHPDGKLRSGWNVVIALLIIFCAVAVPLEIGYETSMKRSMGDVGWSTWEAFNLSVDILFLIDICLNFRTGFVLDGHFITDPYRIASNYVRTNFVVDLIGSFPINFILDAAGGAADDDSAQANSANRLNRQLRLLRIFKLNRLLRLSKLSKYLKYVELLLEFNPSFWRILKLITIMVACCHWMGCAWWLVTDLEIGFVPPNSTAVRMTDWQPTDEVLNGDFALQFSHGFFWGAGMVTAMIPADVIPSTQAENYVTVVCTFIGLMLNAFVIGSMASALSSMDSKKQMCRGKLETIGLYLLVNSVNTDLRTRILEYYEYLYTSSQSMEDLNLLQDLPPSLATRLAISINRRVVGRAPIFNALSDVSLLAVLARLSPMIYVPGQVVLVEGEQIKMINFIKKGHVSLIRGLGSGEEFTVSLLGPNDNFGLDAHATRKLIEQTQGKDAANSVYNVLKRRGRRASSVFGGALMGDLCKESARADTYCDVVYLEIAHLSDILTRDKIIRSAIALRNEDSARKKKTGASSALSVIAKLRLGGSKGAGKPRRDSKRDDKSDDAASAAGTAKPERAAAAASLDSVHVQPCAPPQTSSTSKWSRIRMPGSPAAEGSPGKDDDTMVRV